MKPQVQPPSTFLRFFRWYCHPKLVDHIEGDLSEEYQQRVSAFGKRKADLRFIIDVILLFRPGIIRPAEGNVRLTNYGMIKSYFKIGYRSLLRQKGYSIINIGGLTIGMTVSMLIGLWLHHELSYNKSFENYSRIGQLYHNLDFGGEIITHDGAPYVLGEELKRNFAEFDEVVAVIGPHEHIVATGENSFSKNAFLTDPSFPELFSMTMIEGTRSGLQGNRSIMISRSFAAVLFNGNALGKTLRFDNRDDLAVTGVFEDFPDNSQFADVKMLVPIAYHFSLNEITSRQKNSWENFDPGFYVLLNRSATWEQAEGKIRNFLFEKAPEVVKGLKPEAVLHPMEKWNLYAEFKDGKNTGGKIQFVWMMGVIGAFVLGLACINFINLTTAQSEKRSREVGVRKVMGSTRTQLIGQFMSESFLVVMLSFGLSIGLLALSLPAFNSLTDTNLDFPWFGPNFITKSIIFIVITGVLAGGYPAVYLSSFSPVKVLKGVFKAGRYSGIPRKVLVVFQFTISTALIIGTWIIFQQIQFAKDRPIGFDLKGIIQIQIKTEQLANASYNSLREDLLNTRVVENMATSDFPITGGMSSDVSMTWQGKDPTAQPIVAMNHCSHDFSSTNGFQFIAGRDFSRDHITDSSAVIVNEMAAKLFSPAGSPIGMKLKWGEGEDGPTREIIGVIKDQIRWTPFSNQSPHIYLVDYSSPHYMTIRLSPEVPVGDALKKVAAVIKKYDSGSSFDYKFQDADYARMFKAEERIGKLTSTFSGLAIFISCIGIFGLASFAASQRSKEIGIRKVLGASIFKIWQMLSKDFAMLVVISSIIACPIVYYFATQWLEQYDYKIKISWGVFAFSILGLLVLTLVTVSYRSIKAAMANPVDSLRSE